MDNAEIEQFFRETKASIWQNASLREPQIEGYFAIREHFANSKEPCYVQLPVGCGKTGLMGLTPFGIAQGRILIIAPNLTIRENIRRELNVSNPNCFYSKRGVFVPKNGPYLSELKTGANIHDCDAAHIVVANIQQFSGARNKWYEALPNDYFDMILVDEGHHNVADTWTRLFAYFDEAKVVSFTATPLRSDGQVVAGERVYRFGYARSMIMGFISQIDALFVKPTELTFTVEGETKTLGINEIMKMREKDWFSRGVATSEECNRSIVNASVQQLHHVRTLGSPRQLIAVACSIRHATQVAALYREHGLRVEVLHSQLREEERGRIEATLRSGVTDVVVQVNILGEGYDLPTLSVAAVFRPYRSLSPYVQFVGRILRLAQPDVPYSPANHVYLVSHVGLNDERWWSDFTNFDKDDQEFFHEFLQGELEVDAEGEQSPRMTLRPFMRILNEVVESYHRKGYLKKIDDVMVSDLFATIREKGFEPTEFGLDEEIVRKRLAAAQAEGQVAAFNPVIQPQERREALKGRLQQEARSIADTILNRLSLQHRGRDLLRCFSGNHNSEILIRLASAEQNKVMGVESGQRQSANIGQFESAINASPDIADRLSSLVREKLRNGAPKTDG
ncbi:Superfamily II DNA or RNA helicase [Bradyrhizobium yuanmingense]|uniref:Superfamily II DNA or RNA helicase n=1 Tax=Bradyrhizobium yuanmingense TaxID=108015 RepID=A0A1C3VKL5_9BRAD|nr:DEAD/DEAH box helicase family protein [Bradyrhizobium yuanmingense]TWI28556.1 superfamily II DNA or RNA helicase [Bradyrhizobium yuanmingense]SCB28333.1 Superfamily II DNA or RNA helicase [Bradyrhizobium yuanmingense]